MCLLTKNNLELGLKDEYGCSCDLLSFEEDDELLSGSSQELDGTTLPDFMTGILNDV